MSCHGDDCSHLRLAELFDVPFCVACGIENPIVKPSSRKKEELFELFRLAWVKGFKSYHNKSIFELKVMLGIEPEHHYEYTMKELQDMCKRQGIRGVSKFTKTKLLMKLGL